MFSGSIQKPGEPRERFFGTPGEHDPHLRQEPPDVVDQGRPLFYEKGSHGQEGGQFLLGHRLDRHEPHVRTSHRLADGFGVPPVVLLGLDVRFHVFGVHQLDRVSHLFELPGPVVHPSARFHPDGAGGELRDRLQKPGPGDCLLEDRPAPVVHPVESKNGFCDVDAQRSNLHGGPFSLDVNGKQASPLWLTEAVIPIEAGTISLTYREKVLINLTEGSSIYG
ncbi:hypothetical protein LFML04_1665 [Leptospirillum ferriphilum ML-04]|uniref:Uncharacterized protein n=1 Tax=Leptospirillum ferriphilum (strain ML-04) TaxID=1048260 RepID=J9ZDZ9_LEPFM|nr:hypothetical protein LFML04_1665 [Leptospirillum ferriphilum ML-04]